MTEELLNDSLSIIAREIYFACQDLPTDKVDPTLPECELIAEKILAKVSVNLPSEISVTKHTSDFENPDALGWDYRDEVINLLQAENDALKANKPVLGADIASMDAAYALGKLEAETAEQPDGKCEYCGLSCKAGKCIYKTHQPVDKTFDQWFDNNAYNLAVSDLEDDFVRNVMFEAWKAARANAREISALKEILQEIVKETDGSWDGKPLTMWDRFRELCDEYKGASLPRDVFEGWLDNINDLAKTALQQIDDQEPHANS
jgi:hypothetical protein